MRSEVVTLLRAVTLLLATGCAGQVGDTGPPGGNGPGPGAGGPGGAPSGGGGVVLPGQTPLGDGEFLPTRIRRLTNAEYDNTVAVLLGEPASYAKAFAPDTRQSDFTVNAEQRVDPVLASQLDTAGRGAASTVAAKLIAGLGCAPGDACAQTFVAGFAPKAYRRPVTEQEKSDLFAVFQAGATDATFNDGIALVVSTVLQSASFLYVTELGAGAPAAGLVKLAPYEIASALSYFLTASPPDAALMDAAAAGQLANGAERERQARRLLSTPRAQAQAQRLVKEWLGIDHLVETGKDTKVYPRFDELRPAMTAETDAFIADVIFNDDATLAKLLSADYTTVDGALGAFYGLPAAGAGARTTLTASPRRGLLTQASFLSVHAAAHESAPVKRGATVLKKILCVKLPTPSELNIMVVPPKPDPALTTRERFGIHSKDAACAACHSFIDPIGFALEGFDGMGTFRTTENGRPVNTTTDLAVGALAGTVKDAVELTAKLAASDDARTCFARNMFRFAAAQSGPGFEDKFLKDVWLGLPPARQSNARELLAAYAASEVFVTRKAGP